MAACGILAVMALVQLLIPSTRLEPDASGGLAARRTKPVSIPAVPDYAAILAAPIFAPDRRPDATPSAAADAMQGYAALGAATGRAAVAVISTPDGKTQTLTLGDDVGGWRLVGMTLQALTFEHNGTRTQLVIGAPAAVAPAPPAATDSTGQ